VRFGALPVGTNGLELLVTEQTTAMPNGDFLFIRSTHETLFSQFSNMVVSNATPPPVDTWLCILWSVARATTAVGTIDLEADLGTLILPAQITDGVPPISSVGFGVGFSGPNVAAAQPALDLWIDDVIVNDTPLTCAD
jgi:hypothetical protein